jgi:hypothetical protein
VGDDPIVHVALPRILDDHSACVTGVFSRPKEKYEGTVPKYRVEVSNRRFPLQKLAGLFQPAQVLFFKARQVLGQPPCR